MKNLEQIRALHAHRFWNPTDETGRRRLEEVRGEQGGDVVRGLSSLIISNGLLATLAFAKEKGKGYKTFMEEIGRYLSSQGDDGRRLFNQTVHTLDDFIGILTANDSLVLQQAADESLAYLGYLKRFRRD
ncbi:type III-B CRISPR module-associated protein Cmr5 [Limisphaera sp. 4302-co]|uniref:type III-B CRISPR module-associated protein Cmr5 n=1 Tax=Limisphaera sp. 4302-co TaxID=3400417 RepID=UPI003C238223